MTENMNCPICGNTRLKRKYNTLKTCGNKECSSKLMSQQSSKAVREGRIKHFKPHLSNKFRK